MQRAYILCAVGWLCVSAAPARSDDGCGSDVPVVAAGVSTVGAAMTVPSDALVLFDGRDLSQWVGRDGAARWDVHDGVMTVKVGTGDIETQRKFRDFQLHLEWREPPDVTGEGQTRGNSGVFLQGRYEIQVLDSYRNPTYATGQAGALYGQSAPLVNAMREPGQWNVYDIVFMAPRFNNHGSLVSKARVTVLHNGLLVQNNTEVQGQTDRPGIPAYADARDRGPLRLQDHRDPGPSVSYRNIWVRELNSTGDADPSKDWQYDEWAALTHYREANAKMHVPTNGGARVVFMGDSITDMWPQDVPHFFPGKPYIGRGIGGQTTPQMLLRFQRDVVALRPAVVVINGGTNDIAGNSGPSTLDMIEDNLKSMTQIALANGIKVVLASVTPAYDYPWSPGIEPAEKIVALNKWMRTLCAEHGCIYCDYFTSMTDERHGMKQGLSSDGVHPNAAGYAIMQPIAEKAIAQALAL